MVAAGPARRHYNPTVSPVLDLIRKLSERSDLEYIAIDKPGMRLELRRHRACAAAGDRVGAAS
jgi:oxaloacetate decarboxylase alpha subunit